jgi:hypothetical protein
MGWGGGSQFISLLSSYSTSCCSISLSCSHNTQSPGKMASGVKVAEEVKIKYDDIKKKKSYRYLVFYIKDEKLIAVEKIGERNANYSDFLRDVTGSGPDDCR